jgi:methionyl-tRNA formyltransferase
MTVIKGIGIIVAPTYRSRAYVQALNHVGLEPEICFVLPGQEDPAINRLPDPFPIANSNRPFQFHPDVPASTTISQLGWSSVNLPNGDVNSADNIPVLFESGVETVIYSGKPKALLKKAILEIGIRFLHVHGGYLPVYRGATGFYFGLLVEGKLGNTAIWIDGGVDTGAILDRRWYSPGVDSDVDCVADPVTRADLLIRVVQDQVESKHPLEKAASENYEHFFVIHPILKHLALRFTDGRTTTDNGDIYV